MRGFRAFALTGAVLAFILAVLGSWVRINGAGLTCPDWPLCHGALVPAMGGGVILEWSHRLVALIESFVVLGAVITGWRVRSRIAGVTPALAALAIVFVLQVVLGGATVLLQNSPLSVMLHWAMGMAFLATLTALAVVALLAPQAGEPRASASAANAAAATLGVAAGCAFVTMCAGAYVSSSFAGLACTSVPACDGTLFGNGPAQLAQMIHRLAACAFALVAAYATVIALRTASRRVAAFACAGMLLVVLQVFLGVANVLFRLPVPLREAHAANAGATFVLFVIAAILAALEPYRAVSRVAARARRIASA